MTLLGDAIHAMTPTLGRGANLAMRDGALLGRALKAVAAGERGLASALADYEQQLLAYGFAVVRAADSDDAGQCFRYEAGHLFRLQAGHG
ncbi:FAD-dependent oxidoreductase, partial [Lichenifustis flavocetrariae]|uniref:FAD-dependent oxidoreductase n=1 Tax=Lichenifustis flavocetrariae TaxID=2949735 RepID=UPI0024A6E649